LSFLIYIPGVWFFVIYIPGDLFFVIYIPGVLFFLIYIPGDLFFLFYIPGDLIFFVLSFFRSFLNDRWQMVPCIFASSRLGTTPHFRTSAMSCQNHPQCHAIITPIPCDKHPHHHVRTTSVPFQKNRPLFPLPQSVVKPDTSKKFGPSFWV